MANEKALGPDELLVELLRLGLSHDPTVLQEFHRMIKLVWFQRKEPQRWRDGVIESSGQEKERTEWGNYRGISLVPHVGKVLFTTVAMRLSNY